MRRKKSSTGGILFFVIAIIVVIIVVGKFFIGDNSMNAYKEYVKSYEAALIKYSDMHLAQTQPTTTYEYVNLAELLVESGYLEAWADTNVTIEGDPIMLEKIDGITTFYNYNNLETFENRFELKFTKAGKTYTCTKNECK